MRRAILALGVALLSGCSTVNTTSQCPILPGVVLGSTSTDITVETTQGIKRVEGTQYTDFEEREIVWLVGVPSSTVMSRALCGAPARVYARKQ